MQMSWQPKQYGGQHERSWTQKPLTLCIFKKKIDCWGKFTEIFQFVTVLYRCELLEFQSQGIHCTVQRTAKRF